MPRNRQDPRCGELKSLSFSTASARRPKTSRSGRARDDDAENVGKASAPVMHPFAAGVTAAIRIREVGRCVSILASVFCVCETLLHRGNIAGINDHGFHQPPRDDPAARPERGHHFHLHGPQAEPGPVHAADDAGRGRLGGDLRLRHRAAEHRLGHQPALRRRARRQARPAADPGLDRARVCLGHAADGVLARRCSASTSRASCWGSARPAPPSAC